MVEDHDNDSKASSSPVRRRDVLKYTSGSLVALTGMGTVSAKSGKKKEKTVKRLLRELEAADDPAAYYEELSAREQELVKLGLKPDHVGDIESGVEVTSDGDLTTQGTTTYTERHEINLENYLNQTIITYRHKLDWDVDTGSNEITSVDVSTEGWGFLFWQYDREVDPEYKTVQADGCSSTRSGLFRYCNEVEGVGYCTKELDTKVTSNISGFPNGESSTGEDIDRECGTSC